MESNEDWTTSKCPICGWNFPHKVGVTPLTCSRFDCLNEATRRGMLTKKQGLLGNQNLMGILEHLSHIRDEAEAWFLGRLRYADKVTENMEDYWKHQADGAAR